MNFGQAFEQMKKGKFIYLPINDSGGVDFNKHYIYNMVNGKYIVTEVRIWDGVITVYRHTDKSPFEHKHLYSDKWRIFDGRIKSQVRNKFPKEVRSWIG